MLAEREIKHKKVVQLDDYVYEYFQEFIKDKEGRSKNTALAYNSDIEQFFNIIFGKKPNAITITDMSSLKGNDIVKYRNIIQEKYANSTVNRKIKSVRSFFSYIEADYPEVRQAIFNSAKNLKQEDSKGWGNLTHDEIIKMIEASKELDEQMSLLIEVGYNTSMRLEALLSLTNENIFRREKNGLEFWTIEVMDKGSKNVKPISEELKGKIDKIDNNRHFFSSLNKHKVGKYMKRICNACNIDHEKRNVRFHSIKKAGVNHVLNRTGDIKLAQKQGNHKSATTTLNAYLEEIDDVTKMPSLLGMGNELDLKELENLDKHEIIEILNSLSTGSKMEILKVMSKNM